MGASPHGRPRVLQRAFWHFGRRRRQHPDDHGFFDAALLAGADVGRLRGKSAQAQIWTLSVEFIDVHFFLFALALQLDARRPLLLHHLGLLFVAAAAGGARVDPHLEVGVVVVAGAVVAAFVLVLFLIVRFLARPFVVVRVLVLGVEIEVGLVRPALGVVAFVVGDDALRRPETRKAKMSILQRAFACK